MYTQIESRILRVLSDGLPHDRDELLDCIDDYATRAALQCHMSRLRQKVRPNGQDIVCELYRGTVHYRHIILLLGTDTRYE